MAVLEIENITITYLSEWDGLPVKNHLPIELKERFLTSNQWLEKGYVLKANAVGYDMHPSAPAKRTFCYFIDTEVEKITDSNMNKCCLTCKYRENNSYCFVAGDFVGRINCCSEWIARSFK